MQASDSGSNSGSNSGFIPSKYQSPFNPADYIVDLDVDAGGGSVGGDGSAGAGGHESIELDCVFVGAGPASLVGAIKLAQLCQEKGKKLEIGVLEKAEQLGGHSLSGAVVNPLVFKWLFPSLDFDGDGVPLRQKVKKESFYFLTQKGKVPLPVPPEIKAKNRYYTASLCEIVKWLGAEAQKLGVHIFTAYPGDKLLTQKGKVVGVRSKAFGLNKDGSQEGGYEQGTDILAKAVVLGEGSRGHLTEAYLTQQNIKSKYPQTYALGVKEVWQVQKEPKGIFHTVGWPLAKNTFGGSWLYPLGNGLVSLGLVAGLDSPVADLSVHDELQVLKDHPLFASLLKGGKCLEWGAKTIPEGGYHALPQRLHGDGVLILGDSAGLVNMSSLKGIHYAMASGYFAGETLMQAFEQENFTQDIFKMYDAKIHNSFIKTSLYPYRNLRQSFHKGLWQGLFWSGIITLTRGKWPKDFKEGELKSDGDVKKYFNKEPSRSHGIEKHNAVYLSQNKTRDKIPSHLQMAQNIPKEVGEFYSRMCPAGVYEQKGELKVQPPNCVDCKATDVLGPRWSPRERGSGPNYQLM